MSTPHQRLHIRTLLYELDIPTGTVTEDLVRNAEAASIPKGPLLEIGQRTDRFLESLTTPQAKALAQTLLTGEGVA